MSSVAWQPSSVGTWKDLYVAALLEGNSDRIAKRISEAERAIVERARQLFTQAGDNVQEEEAMDDALYALHALKGCLEMRGRYVDAT